MPSVVCVINTVNQLVWSPDIITDSFQLIHTVWICSDVISSQTYSVTILVIEFQTIQTNVIRITPG